MDIQHSSPAWSKDADFVIGIKVASQNWPLEYSSEQLAAKDLKDGTYKVCAIPFAASDVCIGDIVRVDADFNVVSVVNKGEYIGFRVATKDLASQEAILKKIESIQGTYHEHFSNELMSLAVKGQPQAKKVADILEVAEVNKDIVEYETIAT